MPDDNAWAVWDSPAAAVDKTEKKESTRSDPKVPDGTYRCRIVGWRFFVSGPDSKTPGTVFMVWEFAIMGGMYDGRNLVKMSCPLGRPHDSEDWKAAQAKWSRTDLYRILGRVPAINELLDPETQQTGPVVMDIVGAVAEVELHWKDGNNGQRYANCRINDLVRSPEKSQEELPEVPELPPLPSEPSRGAATPDPEADLLDEIPF